MKKSFRFDFDLGQSTQMSFYSLAVKLDLSILSALSTSMYVREFLRCESLEMVRMRVCGCCVVLRKNFMHQRVTVNIWQ